MNLLVYSKQLNNRFRYAAELVFRNYSGDLVFTDEREKYASHPGPKVFYGNREEKFREGIHIEPVDWIWNDLIENKIPGRRTWNGNFALDFSGHESFDIFAATFYMVTRYEEYQPFTADEHGRFCWHLSKFHESNEALNPVVDLWRLDFEKLISSFFPSINFATQHYHVEATIDVDSAFAYLYKGGYRTLGGIARDLLKLDLTNLKQRLAVIFGHRPDPFDTYQYIIHSCNKHKIPLTWFFLLADFGSHDINLPHTSKKLQELMSELSNQFVVGIHPGYHSNKKSETLTTELQRLESILKRKILHSRQHYLRMKLPNTYQELISQGITDDYTMGYQDAVGYRAGTSFPFPWFDLVRNEKTSLTIHPFALMDATLLNYMKKSPEEACAIVERIAEVTKKTGGVFSILWHNESLSERGEWNGWRRVWEACLSAGK